MACGELLRVSAQHMEDSLPCFESTAGTTPALARKLRHPSSDVTVGGAHAETLQRCSGGRSVAVSLLHGAKRAREEDERVFDGREVQVVDPPYDDPVIAGGMLGDDLALEGGEGVGEQRDAAASEFPVEAGEPVRA